MLESQQWYLLITAVFYINVGRCHPNMEGKVVGGYHGDILDFPHAVCLNAHCSTTVQAFWVCGSTILNQRILITAAHCVDECYHHHQIYAKAGSTNVNEALITRLVVRKKVHGHYDKESLFYDIALLFINGDLPFGRTIKRAVLPMSFPMTSEVSVAGWGVVNEMQKPTVKLKFVRQQLWSAGNCVKYNFLMPGTFCASSGSPEDYPFAGDSGSGLITKKAELIGLVSYRVEEKPELTYYTNISYFLHWIQDESTRLYCNKHGK